VDIINEYVPIHYFDVFDIVVVELNGANPRPSNASFSIHGGKYKGVDFACMPELSFTCISVRNHTYQVHESVFKLRNLNASTNVNY
jgi:hypothetical protein